MRLSIVLLLVMSLCAACSGQDRTEIDGGPPQSQLDSGGQDVFLLPPGCSPCFGPDCDRARSAVCPAPSTMIACPEGTPSPSPECGAECTAFAESDPDSGTVSAFPCLFCCY